MTAGELVYMIKVDRSGVKSGLDEAEKDTKSWGNKISSWTIAKGEMIAKFAEKAVTRVASITKQVMSKTIEAYGTFEQLEGGTKLLFGNNERTLQKYLEDVGITEKSTKKKIDAATKTFEQNERAQEFIFDQAKKAYAEVQMSQNDYLSTANDYAVALKTSLGGNSEAAAHLADDIIRAQADVVAATGKSSDSVANAFAGLLKGNYTMLDNLGLGIKGTKQGMQDVIKQVNAWNKANGKATKYNIKNLADQQKALVDYIKMQGLSGYAGMEGQKTIQGAMATTRAAWLNLLISFGKGEGVKDAVKALAKSAKNLLKAMLPVMKETIAGIGEFVKELIPQIKEGLNNLITELNKSDSPVLQGIGKALEVIKKVISWIVDHKTDVVAAIGAFIGAFTISKLMTIVSNLNPISLIISAIVAAAALIIDNWAEIEKFFVNLWGTIKESVSEAWDKVTEWWTGIKESISAAWAVIATWFDTTVWTPLKTAFTVAWDTIKALWTGVKEVISQAWSNIAKWFDETVWKPLSEFVSPVIEAISGLWDGVKESIAEAWTTIAKWFDETVWTPIKTALQPVIDLVTGLWDGVKGKIEAAWSGVKEVLEPILEPIRSAFEGITTWVDNAIKKVREFLGIDTGSHLTEDQANTLKMGFEQGALKPGEETNPLKEANWNGAVKGLEDAMKKAGFSAEETEAALDKVIENRENPEWIANFVTQLTNSETAAEALKTSIDNIPENTEKKITVNVSANDPDGVLPLVQQDRQAKNRQYEAAQPQHAKGLWTVPYDNYMARLHRKEMVLTASQARRYKEGKGDMNVSGMSKAIVAAIKQGMSGASVNAYVNGDGMTNMVNSNTANRLKGRRFAPA